MVAITTFLNKNFDLAKFEEELIEKEIPQTNIDLEKQKHFVSKIREEI